MPDELRLETVQYRTTKDGPWLQGVLVNEGDGPILTMKGQVVEPPVWDYHTDNHQVMTVYERDHHGKSGTRRLGTVGSHRPVTRS